MYTPLHHRAESQHGVLLARDASELGYTWQDLHDLLNADELVRMFRGAYLLKSVSDTPLTRARAVQMLHPQLVLSHELAAYALGMAVVGQPRLHFTNTGKSRYDIPGGQMCRWMLPAEDIVDADGLRLTLPARTAVDMLRLPNRDTAVIAVDSGLRQGQVTLDEIGDRLERLGGDRGVRYAWRAFPMLDPKSDGPTESKVRLIMWDRGLHPRTQVRIVGADGRVYYLDFEVEGVAVEAEGFAYHGSPQAHQHDVDRFNELMVAVRFNGLDCCRVTFVDAFHRTERTGDLIERTVLARRRRLVIAR